MTLRTESGLMRLYKEVDKLYLAVLKVGELDKSSKKLIEPGKKITVYAKQHNTRPVLVDQDNKVLYLFSTILNKNEGYKLSIDR